jgi:uncharacterized protein
VNLATQAQTLQGPAGTLQLAIDTPPHGAQIHGVAVIAHPHSLMGGTMDNKVVTTIARAATSCGLVAVRFNFRGVGASAGSFDEGQGETQDLLTVLAWAQRQWPQGRRVLAGFSFGAFVAAQAQQTLLAQGQGVHTAFLAGVATSRFTVPVVDPSTVVVHGELDDVVPLQSVLDWARPQDLPVIVVPGASHFFDRKLPVIKRLATDAFNPARNNT